MDSHILMENLNIHALFYGTILGLLKIKYHFNAALINSEIIAAVS